MRPPSPLRHLVLGTIDRVAALLGASEPLHWLTMARPNSRRLRSEPVDLYEIAYAAQKPETVVAPGRSKKQRKPESALVLHRLAPDDTPEGLAAAVPYVAVFEVTPA